MKSFNVLSLSKAKALVIGIFKDFISLNRRKLNQQLKHRMEKHEKF